ncbi:hypothetical protein [Klebsiella oxytoca]|uniref:hypothetical protein n=1 Tax=Klebsiella oxytoca TaxID=571 RepID=UPI00287C587B|nr:hypothetical protein [Klebsiella oxytoca]MDS7772402.1 hypothetical protein [Klebsiella oxytoca]
MAQSNPETITHSFNSIIALAVDERRALTVPERFKVDGILDSLYSSDKSSYYYCYANLAALTGDAKGMDECANYFFSLKGKQLSKGALQCIFALNNASCFDNLYSILKNYDIKTFHIDELITVYLKSAILSFNFDDARALIEELDVNDDCISREQIESILEMLYNFEVFYFSYQEKDRLHVKEYFNKIIKIHREKITSRIYKVAGPSIIRPDIFSDEGNVFMNVIIEYVSDDIDYAMDIENYFYKVLRENTKDIKANIMSSVVYNILPISSKDSLPFTERVIEVGLD